MRSFQVEIGRYLATRRVSLHIKISDVLKTIKYNRINYYYYESGKSQFPLSILPTICNLLSINIDDVFDLSKTPNEYIKNEEINLNLLSKNIRNIRKKNNLTQIMCADKLSIDKKTMHNYESQKYPTITFIKSFCDYFKVKPSQLFYSVTEE